jgi:opacity protein-like surface antigen
MLRFAFLCICLSGVAFAQVGFGAGLKGGFASPGWFQDTSGHYTNTDRSSGFTGGPYVEARFGPFSVDVEALYRKIGVDIGGGYVTYWYDEQERGSMWRVPMLAKMRLPQVREFRPFVEAGPSFMRMKAHVTGMAGIEDVNENGQPITVSTTVDDYVSHTSSGFTFGAGLERRIMPLRVTFEGRMTRWREGDIPGALNQPNQFEFLFGIGF